VLARRMLPRARLSAIVDTMPDMCEVYWRAAKKTSCVDGSCYERQILCELAIGDLRPVWSREPPQIEQWHDASIIPRREVILTGRLPPTTINAPVLAEYVAKLFCSALCHESRPIA
jgi:hypothetical protein